MEDIIIALGQWGQSASGFTLGFALGLLIGMLGTIVLFLVADNT